MNIKQIAAKLSAENIQADIKSNKLIEVARYDEDGDIDREATEQAALKASEVLGWTGFKNGWGGWTLLAKG